MRKKFSSKKNISPRITCNASWRLTKVNPLPNYTLAVEFKDGTKGLVNMTALIQSSKAGVFSHLKNLTLFNQVHLEYGVATWPGEIDLAPDAMYDAIQQKGIWEPGTSTI
jgi:hypothetical protein